MSYQDTHSIDELIYIDETHDYFYKGKKLISTTELLAKHNLSTNYNNVDRKVLEAKAELGKQRHKEFELYFKGELSYDSLSSEVKSGIDILNNNFMIILTEKKVNNDIVAGTLDIYALNLNNDEFCLIDIKNTYNLNKTSVAWQLSIYKELLGKQVDRLYALWFNREFSQFELIEVREIPKRNIEFLFECEIKGDIYNTDLVSSMEHSLLQANQIGEQIKYLEESIKQLKNEKEKLDAIILNGMEQYDLKTLENDYIRITLVESKDRITYDYKTYLDEKGIVISDEDLEKIKKVSKVKPYLKYTHKGE